MSKQCQMNNLLNVRCTPDEPTFHQLSLTYITYNNDNNQDKLILNYNLLKIIVYESSTAYDKVFPLVTHF